MVTYTQKAWFALHTMESKEQSQVKAIEPDLDRPIGELLRSGIIKKLDMPEDVYLTRIGDDIVVMLDQTPEGTRILDIVPWERIVNFHNALHAGASA